MDMTQKQRILSGWRTCKSLGCLPANRVGMHFICSNAVADATDARVWMCEPLHQVVRAASLQASEGASFPSCMLVWQQKRCSTAQPQLSWQQHRLPRHVLIAQAQASGAICVAAHPAHVAQCVFSRSWRHLSHFCWPAGMTIRT